MPEDQKSSFSEAVETGASAAHTICGAIKTGKAISSAAKGAAAGGPYGAVAGAVWAGRKHIGKIIVAVIALLMLPVLFVLMLPGLIFGGLTNAFSPSDPEIPILNSETAIIENANEITFTLNGILGEALDDVLARIEADFAASGADHMEVKNAYSGGPIYNANLFISQYAASFSSTRKDITSSSSVCFCSLSKTLQTPSANCQWAALPHQRIGPRPPLPLLADASG